MVRIALLLSLLFTAMSFGQTITNVTNESGAANLCPGGVAFVQGSNLGNTSTVITVAGKNAYVFNAFGGTSLQFQAPVDAPLGPTTLKAGNSAPFNVTLVQYCPALPVNNPGSIPYAVHQPSGFPVSATSPATPNELIAISASGLGPTNPVVATGQSPNDNSAAVLAKPAITVGGKNATVSKAYLQPNNPGFYEVEFTMPADITSGSQPVVISVGGATGNTAQLAVSTGGVGFSATNAASYITVNPRRGIAQGSIFVVQGVNLGPKNLTIAPAAFQNTTLSGTSISVTVNGTTVSPLMYYTSAGQLAALMPSNTPIGQGTLSVTYNGQAGPGIPINVVPNTVGIFTVSSDGQGAGIVTYPDYSLVSTAKAANCGGPNTTCGAANAGDALIIWATGLGAVSGGDASGAGLGVNMPSVPVTIYLGNVQVTPVYQGRSGCCIGEDQIVFTVPANAPTGCAVPLSVQANGFQSNTVQIPIAPAGSRTCAPTNPAFTSASVASIAATGSADIADITLMRSDHLARNNTPGFEDDLDGEILRIGLSPAIQPFGISYLDVPPVGTCAVYNTPNGAPDPPLLSVVPLDAGPQITAQGPNGSKNALPANGSYRGVLSATGNFLVPGNYTVNASGGKDVPAFSAQIAIPATPVMTSPPPGAGAPTAVTRANGLNVTWTGGTATQFIVLDGVAAADNTFNTGTSFECIAPATAGSFTIPPNILQALPATNFGALLFHPSVLPTQISGTKLDFASLNVRFETYTPLSFR